MSLPLSLYIYRERDVFSQLYTLLAYVINPTECSQALRGRPSRRLQRVLVTNNTAYNVTCYMICYNIVYCVMLYHIS